MKLIFAVSGFSVVLACTAMPAHAIGRLADVTVVDRDSGLTLPVHVHRGEYWIAGRPGARYAIAITNRLGERVIAVTSVDGVNVVNGETAAWNQTGYVFSSHAQYQITGWRKSSNEVAAFEFSDARDSYAGRTGRPNEVGVIGVAVFRERLPEPVAQAPAYSPKYELADRQAASRHQSAPAPASSPPGESRSDAAAGLADKSRAETTPQSEGALASSANRAGATLAPLPTPKLGTGHGQREESVVTHTSFVRRQSQPNEIIRIRYDSRDRLIASGVIRAPVPLSPMPNPFPDSDRASYVPDPPVRRY